MISILAATIRNQSHCLIWPRMPRKANDNEKSRSLFIMKRDLRAFDNQRRAASQIPEFIMESEEQRPRREEPSTRRTSANMHFVPKDDGV